MAIVGAILGDIAGSQYEYDRPEDLDWKNCELFTDQCTFTDDTVMTLAIKHALKNVLNLTETMQKIGREYPYCGYGKIFFHWIHCKNPIPYGSFGNGAAMRVSFIGEYYEDKYEVKSRAERSALVSHHHPEGVKGASTTAICVWMAKHNFSKDDIYEFMLSKYPQNKYPFSDRNMEFLREHYEWDITCMTSVPVAIRCFYESNSYESFLRNVLSLRCDTDTLCAIGGGIAEEYYKKTGFHDKKILERYLDDKLMEIVHE